jgi:transcriptional regulator with XRE-family HTH domain
MSNDMGSHYLRRKRKMWGLSQQELAQLIGGVSRSQLSRMEREETPPSKRVLAACQFLFNCPGKDLFPNLYAAVEDHGIRAAYELYQSLENDESPKALRKKAFLDQVRQRAIKHIKPTSNL